MLNDGHFGIWLDIENIKKKPQSETTIMPLKVKKLKLTLSDFFILSQKFFFFLYYQVNLGAIEGVRIVCVARANILEVFTPSHRLSRSKNTILLFHWKCRNILIFLGWCVLVLGYLLSVGLCFPSFFFSSLKWQLDPICCWYFKFKSYSSDFYFLFLALL